MNVLQVLYNVVLSIYLLNEERKYWISNKKPNALNEVDSKKDNYNGDSALDASELEPIAIRPKRNQVIPNNSVLDKSELIPAKPRNIKMNGKKNTLQKSGITFKKTGIDGTEGIQSLNQ